MEGGKPPWGKSAQKKTAAKIPQYRTTPNTHGKHNQEPNIPKHLYTLDPEGPIDRTK